MSWIKTIIVDILVTALIVLTTLQPNDIAFLLITGYTILIFLLKATVLYGDALTATRPKVAEMAPEWIIYGLYLINMISLLIAGKSLLAAGWLAIGILSWMAMRKLEKSRKNIGRKRTKKR